MIIYLDVLIIVNLYITYFTLKATARLLHLGYKTGRLIAASALGGLASLTAVIPVGFFISLLLRIAVTFIITITAFGFSGIKSAFVRCGVNITAATLICGIAIMLRELTGSSFFGAAGGYPYLDISVMTLVFATTTAYIIITLFRRFSDKPTSGQLIKITIKNNGKTATLDAFPDSGNGLRDFLTGMPVIICKKEKIADLFPIEEEMPSGARIIPFSSVGGSGCITAFRAENVTAENESGEKKSLNVLIGINDKALYNEKFDAILNPKILI